MLTRTHARAGVRVRLRVNPENCLKIDPTDTSEL